MTGKSVKNIQIITFLCILFKYLNINKIIKKERLPFLLTFDFSNLIFLINIRYTVLGRVLSGADGHALSVRHYHVRGWRDLSGRGGCQ